MTAKEYLLQAYLLEERIDSKLMQVERLRGLATKSTAIIRMDPGGGSGDGDFMENTIIRIVDMEREITAEMERLVSLKREIAGVIGQVDDPALQTLLRALKKVERILGSGMKWDNMGQDGTKDSVI